MQSLLRKLPQGMLVSFFLQGTIAGLSFLSTLLVARYTGDEGFGIYSLVFTWLSLLGLVATWGGDDILLKEFSSTKEEKRQLFARLWAWTFRNVLLLSLFCSLGFLGLIAYIPSFGLLEYIDYFLLGLPVLALYAFLLLGQAALRGRSFWFDGQVAEKLLQPLAFILAMLFWIFWQGQLSNRSLILARSFSFALAALLLLFLLYRRLPWLSWRPTLQKQRAWAEASRAFVANTILFALSTRLDILFLGYWQIEAASIGHYNLGLKIAELSMIPFLALSTVALPRFSRYYKEGRMGDLQSYYKQINRLSLLTGGGALLFLALTAPYLLMLYGKSFDASYPYFLLFLFPKLLYFFLGPMNVLLLMTGQTKALNRALFFNMLLAFLAYPLALQFLGLWGAALVAAATSLLFSLQMALLLRRQLGISAGIYFR